MSFRIVSLSLALLSTVAACERGTARPDEAAPWVELDWVVEAKLSHGKFSTTLPSGERFEGTYLNVTRDTGEARLQPFHAAWGKGFSDPTPDLTTWRGDREGHVIGLLDGSQSTKMRCILTLDLPDAGLEGGGEGTCELSSGKMLRARFGAR